MTLTYQWLKSTVTKPEHKQDTTSSLQLCHTERDDVSRNRLDCLLSHLFRRRSKKTSKLRVTGLLEGNPLVTGGFPSQRASNAKNVSIWWRHHAYFLGCGRIPFHSSGPSGVYASVNRTIIASDNGLSHVRRLALSDLLLTHYQFYH